MSNDDGSATPMSQRRAQLMIVEMRFERIERIERIERKAV